MRYKNTIKKLYLIFVLCLLPACFENKKTKDHKVKVIVWDFDGTLADSFSLAIKCINTLSSEYGYRPVESARDIALFRECSMQEIVSKHLGLKFYQIPGYATQAKKLFNENLVEVHIFDGMHDLLRRLAAKYEQAIITSNSELAVRKTLEKGGVLSAIKYIHYFFPYRQRRQYWIF